MIEHVLSTSSIVFATKQFNYRGGRETGMSEERKGKWKIFVQCFVWHKCYMNCATELESYALYAQCDTF